MGEDSQAKVDLLELLLAATNDGVVDWDLVSGQTHYNERWRFLLGWDDETLQLQNDTWRELIHEADRPSVEQALKDHLDQGWPFQQTIRMLHRGSGWRWILIQGGAQHTSQGVALRMVLVFTDVDARIRAENGLRALIEAVPDVLLRVRSDGGLLAAKDEAGLEQNAVVLAPASHWLLASSAETAEGGTVLDCIQNVARTGHARQVTCRLRLPSGQDGELDIRIVACGADEALCIARDVSRERQLLEQLGRRRNLEAIGQLATGIAHEVNTPLQYIGDNLNFVADSVGGLFELLADYRAIIAAGVPVASRAKEALHEKESALDAEFLSTAIPSALGTVAEGVGQIHKVVSAMKRFEEAGRLAAVPTEIGPLLENAITICRSTWKDVAEVDLRPSANLPLIVCVPVEIAQVIINLVKNAAQAIADRSKAEWSKGRITIVASSIDRAADIGPESQAPWVEIRVTDDGIGIPEGIRNRVFDPFFTTRAVGSGLGQGLTYVHDIVVRQHGGTVHFESREGVGTTFVVWLPAGEAQTA